MATYYIVITGKVQGVFHRVSTRDKARELNLSGFVRNTEDGSVEIMVTGGEKELKELVSWCKIGPAGAVVNKVTVNPVREIPYKGFSIVR